MGVVERGGRAGVVSYSGDYLGCIASRMGSLGYNVGRRFTRSWMSRGG